MTPVNYISTRGQAPILNFEQATLAGLADDGGLYVPETWPTLSHDEIRALQDLSYPDLAVEIISRFTGDSLSRAELEKLVAASYSGFSHQAIAPIKQLDNQLYFMELFQGPTLAFKDFALQFLGQTFDHFLTRRNARCTIVGATSGDTGSAAIEAVKGLSSVDLFMLHPEGRVSDVQRKQMTSCTASNVYNLAMKGDFDDCQNTVKALFADKTFKTDVKLSAVNSINWARIAAQIVYYFRAALALGAPDRRINVSVPTGNFGNVFAAYVAKQMGLPIDKFIIGSNRNDILTRFFVAGEMTKTQVEPSLSPSMDIQISSNFERFLFESYGRDSQKITELMAAFSNNGQFSVSDTVFASMKSEFSAFSLNDEDTKAAIKRYHERTGEIIDPHSIIGLVAAEKLIASGEVKGPVVCMGTAHPAKFVDAVEAVIGQPVPFPERLNKVMDAPERFDVIDNDVEAVKAYVQKHIQS